MQFVARKVAKVELDSTSATVARDVAPCVQTYSVHISNSRASWLLQTNLWFVNTTISFLLYRLAAAKLNMETAQEDAEYMAEELERYLFCFKENRD